MFRRTAVVVATLTGTALIATPAQARASVPVSISNFAFDPHTVRVEQGSTVTWTNNDTFDHTSTSRQGFWNSHHIAPGGDYSQTAAFLNAGSYAYRCTIHNMPGIVRVPLLATGTAASGYTLRWSSASSAPANRNFDVQIKRPGASSFAAFKSMTTALTAFVNPAKAGNYEFRARTRNTSNGKTSDWSPVRTLPIS